MKVNKRSCWSINRLAEYLLDKQILEEINHNRKYAFKIAKRNLKVANRNYKNGYILEFK